MATSESQLRQLAKRAKRGDDEAALEWQRAFEAQVARIVRRSLRQGQGKLKIARRILALAKALEADFPSPFGENRERQVRKLAGKICDSVVDKLQNASARAAAQQKETVHDR